MCYNPHMDNLDFLKFYTETPKYTHEPGLEVIQALMAKLGDPQKTLRCVHIAGTNGKGSCAAMTASVLRAGGRKTGLYTSPDLNGIWERIQVDGVCIALSDLERITRLVRNACEGLPEPSFFEKITAAAFIYFAEQECDAVVLETGLGGRIDQTNIIEEPLCSVIMPIGFDHTAQLGNTLAAIAAEKAGIIKKGCPVVCAPQEPEALQVIQAACREKASSLHLVDTERLRIQERAPSGLVFSYDGMEGVRLSLAGDHQARNAAAVIETARILGLSETDIRAGLGNVRWPCRFEYFEGDPPLLLDGAHNAHGAASLAAGLEAYFPGTKFTMLMGVLADKDHEKMLELLEPFAARFVCIAPEDARALPAGELASHIQSVPAETAVSLPEALRMARSYGDPVCAFGSLYYIGALRNLLVPPDR